MSQSRGFVKPRSEPVEQDNCYREIEATPSSPAADFTTNAGVLNTPRGGTWRGAASFESLGARHALASATTARRLPPAVTGTTRPGEPAAWRHISLTRCSTDARDTPFTGMTCRADVFHWPQPPHVWGIAHLCRRSTPSTTRNRNGKRYVRFQEGAAIDTLLKMRRKFFVHGDEQNW